MKIAKKKLIYITGIVFVVLICVYFSPLKENLEIHYVRSQVSVHKKNTAKLLKEHEGLLTFLEDDIYPVGNNLRIDFDNGKLNVSGEAGKEQKEQIAEYEIMLKRVFEELSCKNLRLYNQEGKKILGIYFGDVKITKNNIFYEKALYCKDGRLGYVENVFKNWYYEALFYT
jgi:hypothetical protein